MIGPLELEIKSNLEERFNVMNLRQMNIRDGGIVKFEANGYFWIEQHEKPLFIEYPTDWWEAFKERWLPKLGINYSKCFVVIRTLFPNIVSSRANGLLYNPDMDFEIFRSVPIDTLKKQRFSVILSLSEEILGHDTIEYVELLTQEFDYSLTELTRSKSHKLKFPTDWQQAFKERWFPEWLTDRYPVEFMTINPNDMGIEYDNPLHNEDFVHIVWSVTYE